MAAPVWATLRTFSKSKCTQYYFYLTYQSYYSSLAVAIAPLASQDRFVSTVLMNVNPLPVYMASVWIRRMVFVASVSQVS